MVFFPLFNSEIAKPFGDLGNNVVLSAEDIHDAASILFFGKLFGLLFLKLLKQSLFGL